MTFKVVATMAIKGVEAGEEIARGAGMDFECRQWHSGEDELIELVSDADAIITLAWEPFTPRVIQELRLCRVISSVGIGYNNIDVVAATEQGICLTNNPRYCLEEVADHTMFLILACSRRAAETSRAVKAGWWFAPGRSTARHDRSVAVPMFRLAGRTLGLIGFGNTARSIVPKAKAFGLRIVAYSPHLDQDVAQQFGVEAVELSALLRQADFVSVHARVTSTNEHMLGLEQFRLMKPTAYLINTARGALINESDLVTALEERCLAGAALDVLEKEPPDLLNPLLGMDNVFVTGHTAAYSEDSIKNAFAVPAQEVVRTLTGEWPANLVNPDVKPIHSRRWRAVRSG